MIATGSSGLDNQTSSIGQYVNLGHVNAGDSIAFEVEDLSSGKIRFTDNSENSDGLNHAYMTPFAEVSSALQPFWPATTLDSKT